MSENTWRLMQGMESENVELQMALQCAPVITGVKISNLLSIKPGGYRQVADIVAESGISMYTLGAARGRVNVLLYNSRLLSEFLHRADVSRLFVQFGYKSSRLDEILPVFRARYQKYIRSRYGCMDDREWFPHEMGLLLGYPPEDVVGFIENDGKNCLCGGYWKVYKDAEKKKRIFKTFERAEEKLIGLLSDGVRMRDIMGIYSMERKYA